MSVRSRLDRIARRAGASSRRRPVTVVDVFQEFEKTAPPGYNFAPPGRQRDALSAEAIREWMRRLEDRLLADYDRKSVQDFFDVIAEIPSSMDLDAEV